MSSSPTPARPPSVSPERLAEAASMLFETAAGRGSLESLWLRWAVHPEGVAAERALWLAWDVDAGRFESSRDLDRDTPAVSLPEALRRERAEPRPARDAPWTLELECLPADWRTLWSQAAIGPVETPSEPRLAPAGEQPVTLLAVRAGARDGGLLVLAGTIELERARLLHRVAVATATRRAHDAGHAARARHRAAMATFAAVAGAPGNLAESLHALLRTACEGLSGTGAALWRVEGDGRRVLHLAAGAAALREHIAAGLAAVAADALSARVARHAGDGRDGPGPAATVIAELSAWAVTPIVAFGQPLGVLAVWDGLDRESREGFSPEDVECVQALARQAALLLELARRQEAETAAERDRVVLTRRVRHLESVEGLREVAARVAAEARNPLASIGAFARRAQKSLAAGDPERDSLDIVIREAERLEAMLNEQLQYSRIEPAALRMESLNETLQASLQGVGETLVRRRLRLTKRLAADLPPLLLDAPRIRRVFENVLAYALDAAPIGGRLRVETRRAGAFALVEIAHDGPRQAGDLIEHLFMSFAGGVTPGAAVGLALAHQIVREHGGEVRVRSEGEWSAVFSCTLPIADNADRRDLHERRATASDRRRRGPDESEGLPLG